MLLDRKGSVGYLTNLAGRLLVRELERRLRAVGLAPACMPVLLALEDGSAKPQKALAEGARVEQATMTATLNRMERDGLVRRSRNPDDGRSTLVSLTPEALSRLPQVLAITTDINALALEPLGPEEQKTFLALIGRIISALETREHGAGR